MDLYKLPAVPTFRLIVSAMRHFFAIGSGIALGLAVGHSQSLNIATWMVELPETNSTNRASEYEPVLRRVAGVLKPLNADILLLHGIPDRATAKQLSGILRPRVYHNASFSSFRKNAQSQELVEPPVTILSRKQPIAARSTEWRSTGQIDVPGGFSVAIFNFGGSNSVFLYTVQFPKPQPGMTPQQEATIPRKRELSARYLVAHANWLTETSTNSGRFVYMATDLELDAATATNDPVLAVLTSNGFKASGGSRTLVASTALSSTGWPPPGGLVSAFIRGAEFPGDPESISRRTFFAPVALVEMDLNPLAAQNAALASAALGPASTSLPGDGLHLVGNEWRSLWLIVAGAALVLGFLAVLLRARRRSRRESLALSAGRPGLDHQLPSSGRVALHEQTEGPIQLVQRPVQSPLEGSRAKGGRAERETDEGEPAARSSSVPFLHLLRERLVRWLAAERSQLLSSHHAGAEQVLELEERLTRIQNQFESRLRAREQRVSELEAELMTKERAIGELEQTLANRGQRPSRP
jgi:hypothetical protein